MLSIVIVNWNSGALLAQCLTSIDQLEKSSLDAREVIVVDNASIDGSIEWLRERSGIEVILNRANAGFGRACNQGAAIARGDVLLFLNPDCRVGRGSIEACLKLLDTSSDIGVVGVGLSDDRGLVARSCSKRPKLRHMIGRLSGLSRVVPSQFDLMMSDWAHDADRDVEHVIGAFYMIRRDLFERLHGFDETFFVYLEDLDLSTRVRENGYRIRFIAGPSSYHQGGGASDKVRALRTFYSIRSRIQYSFKHFGRVAGWAHLAATLTLEPIVRGAHILSHGRSKELREVAKAFSLLAEDLPNILRSTSIRRPT